MFILDGRMYFARMKIMLIRADLYNVMNTY